MSNFVSQITLKFQDYASSGMQKLGAQASMTQKKISGFANEINNSGGLMSAARDIGLVSMAMGEQQRQFSAMVGVPSRVQAELENSMARVHTVLSDQNAIGGDTAQTLQKIEKSALQMGAGASEGAKLVSISAEQYSSSVYTMLSSGLKAQAAMAATEQAALLAKATGGHLSDSAAILTGLYNNFGDKARASKDEMLSLSDTVAATQNYFAFENLSQFTDGLKNVSGAAVANKVPLTQVSAVIGQLNTNLIKGSEAGTAAKSMLAQMSNASSKLGFDIAHTANGGLDMIATLENIKALGLDGQTLMKGFGTEAGPAVSLLTANLNELKMGFKAVHEGAGVTLLNASKMADTLANKQERLNNATEVMQAHFGQGANRLNDFTLSMKMWTVSSVNAIAGSGAFGQSIVENTGAIVQFLASSSGVFVGLLNISTGLLSTMALFSKFAPILKLTGVLIKGFALGLGKGAFAVLSFIPKLVMYTAATWSAVAANIALYWPIYAIVAAVAAVSVGAVLLIKNWSKVKAFFIDLWAGVKETFSASIEWIQSKLEIFFQTFSKIMNFFKGGKALTETMADGIKSDVSLEASVDQKFSSVDRMIPHSDAKDGPFSRLTQAGAAIPATMAVGVKNDESLKVNLGDAFAKAGSVAVGANSTTGQSIHIENLSVQAQDMASAIDFINMLKREIASA